MTPLIALDVVIEDAEWQAALPDAEALASAVLGAASAETGQGGELAILLTHDGHMQALNQRWRGKDSPTDVLSFESGEPLSGVPDPFLGDIAIGLGIMARDALSMDKPLATHFQHLVVHGYLHLLGYDHESETDAHEMESLEISILARIGLPDPYREPN